MSAFDPFRSLAAGSKAKAMTVPFNFIISLRATHPGKSADEIVRSIGLEAKRAWSAGEPKTSPNGRLLGGNREVSYAAFRMSAGSDGELTAAIGAIVETLKFRRAALKDLTSSGGALSLFVSWHCTGDNGDTFSASLLGELASLQINLDLNVLPAQS